LFSSSIVISIAEVHRPPIQVAGGIITQHAPNTLFASEARQIVIEIVQYSRAA
jgi:hypothetical protein